MITQLILKHSVIELPVMVYDNETMYIDESVKHILWNMKDKMWILWAETKELTRLNCGYLEMESAKFNNGICPNYIKVKFK